MASLFLARDPVIDRLVAIKVLREGFDNDELRERFAREARSVGRLRHANIVTIFDVGEQDGQPFIAMEYIAGQTLADMIRSGAPVPLARRLRLLVHLCAGLGYAHHAGIVHRDIKPANLIVDADDVLKILDFGIARAGDSSMTHAGMLVGTLNYMSPEQVAGLPVDHRSDIFATGVVAYEFLSYRQAFPGDLTTGILHRILNTEPSPLDTAAPGLGPDIVRIVSRAIQKDPSRRYQDLANMRKDLEDALRRLPDAGTMTVEEWEGGATARTLAPETPPPRGPIRGIDAALLARRRATQIQSHLDAARDGLQRGDHEGAIAACEQALVLDPDSRPALDLLDEAHTEAQRADAQRRIGEARDAVASEHLTQAGQLLEQARSLDPGAPGLAAVAETIEAGQRERDRKAAVARLIADAEQRLRIAAPDSALRIADHALTFEPDNAEALAIRERAAAAIEERRRQEEARQAREIVGRARARFAAGERAEAIADLQAVRPAHPMVSEALAGLRADLAEIERRAREEAERAAEAARKAREEAERRARAEAERKAREEAQQQKAREEAERRAREEAERKARAEAQRRARELAEQRAREEAELRAREEAERKARAEQERQARAEAKRREREEAEQRAAAAREAQAQRKAQAAQEARERAQREREERERQARVERDAREARQREEARRRAEAARLAESSAPTIARPLDGDARPTRMLDSETVLVRPRAEAERAPPAAAAQADPPPGARAPVARGRTAALAAAALVIVAAVAASMLLFGRSPLQQQTAVVRPAPVAPAPTAKQEPTAPKATTGQTPQPAAPVGVEAKEPAASGIPADSAAEQARRHLGDFKTRARDELQRGNREQALTAASQALGLNAGDRDMTTLVNGLLADAIRRLVSANKAAVEASAGIYAEALFTRATGTEAEAERLNQQRRSVAAVRAYWKAADFFDEAASEARAKKLVADRVAAEKAAADRAAAEKANAAKAAAARMAAEKTAADRAAADRAAADKAAADKAAADKAAADRAANDKTAARTAIEKAAADQAGVKASLDAYRTSYENLDIAAVKRYRSLNRTLSSDQIAKLESSFRDARAYDVQMATPTIVVNGDTATASCEIVYRYIPKAGNPPPSQTESATFRLQRNGSSWAIVGIDVRRPR